MREKINELKEQRIMQATKNQLTQKLLMVAKQLGKPITAHSVFGNQLNDPWQLEDDLIYDPTVVYDPDEYSMTDLGFHFDGLQCGINLCVTSLIYDNKVDELKATYNGYLVFAEVEGELKAYAPFPAWEDAVNMFYEAAVQLEKKRQGVEKEQKRVENRKKLENFWKHFKMLWGY